MSPQAMSSELLDDGVELTLVDFCRASSAGVEQVRLWVLEGVLEPRGTAPHDWRFSPSALRRARVALRLTRDLEVNAPGVALALDLMEEIEALQSRLRRAGLQR